MKLIYALYGLAPFLTSCAMVMPQNAQEFRDATATAYTIKKEILVVDRSFQAVLEDFKRHYDRCLSVNVKRVSNTSVIFTDYRPTLKVSEKKAELYLQYQHRGGVINVLKIPPGGYYALVVDIVAAGKNRTDISMFRPTFGYSALNRAIRGWADGTISGCPDLP